MNKEDFTTDNSEIKNWLIEYRKTDDPEMKKKLRGLLVMAYLPLVTKVARSFARRSSDPVEDIVQVGSIGLLKAMDLYSPQKNTGFKTYATYLITGEIRHYLRDKTSMIRAPREIRELSYRVHKITLELTQKYGSTPTDEQLAQALQMPQKKIEEVINLDRRTSTVSYDQMAAIEADAKNDSLVEKIPDESIYSNEEVFENKIILEEAINSLALDSRNIIRMCFYEGLNQREISEKLNMSQMQVSRKMKKALLNLFEYVTSRGVKPYE
ncbi:MAG: sigma-70 family RNA polymerase sigma factor [Candidatus Gastranaerophilales bacterium]|nr:sigma-70 family RNA polymerase sigma factor [Candidatus Gastranaerophilales bacterium]